MVLEAFLQMRHRPARLAGARWKLWLLASLLLLWSQSSLANSHWCDSGSYGYQAAALWCVQAQADTAASSNVSSITDACHTSAGPYSGGWSGTFVFHYLQWGSGHGYARDWWCPGATASSAAKDIGKPTSCACVGDPIQARTGNVFVTEPDLRDSGKLEFTRYYNSDPSVQGLRLGPHWTHTYSRRIRYTAGDGGSTPASAVLAQDDGREYSYQLINGVWSGEADVADELTSMLDASGNVTGWLVRHVADRSTEGYGVSGELLTVTDENGLVTTLAYETDPAGSVAVTPKRLTSVTDPGGRRLTLAYDSLGRLSSFKDPAGILYTYSYDGSGLLQGIAFPDTTSRSYSYNEAGHSSSGTAANPLLTGVLDELGQRATTYDYDATGRGIQTSAPNGVNRHQLIFRADGGTDVTDPLGQVRTHTFSVFNGTTYPSTVAGPCLGCGGFAQRTYNFVGDLTQGTDFNGVVTNYAYDINHFLTQKVEAVGTSDQRDTQTTWNDFHQPVERRLYSASYVLLTRTSWVYNSRGQPTAQCDIDWQTAPGYVCTTDSGAPAGVRKYLRTYCDAVDSTSCPIVGLLLTVVGPRSDVQDVTSYSYYVDTDESGCGTEGGPCHHPGDLKTITDAVGMVTTYVSYDKTGRATRVKEPNGVLTDYTFTPRGWLATTTVRANASGVASSGDAVTTIAYDPTGTVHQMTDADGVSTTYGYDAAQRLTDITDALGNRVHYTLDAAGNRTVEQVVAANGTVTRSLGRTFNALGQLTAVTDGLNSTVFSASFADSFDANGNLIHSQDGLGHQTKQAFDGLNRLVSTLQNYQGTDTATANSQTVNTFDALDRVGGFSDPEGLNTTYDIDAFGNPTALHSPDTGTTSHTFDVAGNALTSVDATNNSRARTYDADNRLLTETFADTSLNVQYQYDEADTVTGCTGSFGKGRLTRVIEGNGGIVWCYDNRGNVVTKQQTVGTVTRTTTYAWTAGNRLAWVTTPNGTSIAYIRNALGQIASIQATPSGGAATTVVSNVVHMPYGPVASYTLGDGQAVTLTYDANGAWTDVASTAFSLHVKRDVMGNIVALGNAAGVPTATETYSYDPLYRLTGVNAADGSAIEAYTYNKTGDRLSKTAPGLLTGTYNYATGTHHLTGVGTTTRAVDARGNTTADVLASGTFGYGYNGRNRLTVIQNGGVTVGSYVLNALGQRVQKTAGGTTTRFDYEEDSRLLAEGVGTTTRDYVWMDSLPVGIVDHAGSTTTVNFVHADGLGSPRAVTSATGTVLWQWAYAGNTFGEKAPISSTGFTLNLRFPGQYFDAESGLHYNVSRDYEPGTGRYIQSDPAGLEGGATTYSYVSASPLLMVDESGLAATGTGALCMACHNGVLPGFPGAVPLPQSQPMSLPTSGAGADVGDGTGDLTKPDKCPQDKPCPPCVTVSGQVIPVGTIGHRSMDILPSDTIQHGIAGSHYNLYRANQAPRNSPRPCKCFWQAIGAVRPDELPLGAVHIEPFAD
jgi:RHS repeat-associated protein